MPAQMWFPPMNIQSPFAVKWQLNLVYRHVIRPTMDEPGGTRPRLVIKPSTREGISLMADRTARPAQRLIPGVMQGLMTNRVSSEMLVLLLFLNPLDFIDT